MLRTALAFFAFLALTANASLLAQESAAGSAQSQQQLASGDHNYRRIEGCLAFNGVSYVLAVVSNGPKQYRVIGGDVTQLKGKVGHTMEIAGETGVNNPGEMMVNPDMREATTGVGWYTIVADQVKEITSNCSYPGFERPLSQPTQN
jgi:hypothetical protein